MVGGRCPQRMSPDEDRATGNLRKKTGEDRTCSSEDMIADRQTDRQTDRHTHTDAHRPWPSAYFLNGPTAAASIAPTQARRQGGVRWVLTHPLPQICKM